MVFTLVLLAEAFMRDFGAVRMTANSWRFGWHGFIPLLSIMQTFWYSLLSVVGLVFS